MNSDNQNDKGTEPLVIALDNGEELRGTYLWHEPACVVFATASGERRLLLTEIPADLQRCFPADPFVAAMAQFKRSESIAHGVMVQVEENATTLQELTESVRAIEEHNRDLPAEIETLRAENAALHAENTALMRSQGESK